MKGSRTSVWMGSMVSAAVVLSGCGGGGHFGEDVSLPQAKRHRLVAATPENWPLKLPADRAFNVTDTQRRSEGAARTSSTAIASGSASCSADATLGGSGVAEFQMGHVLTYDGTSALDVTVTFDVAYECALDNVTPQFGVKPLALKAYVMNSDRRMLAKVMLADGDAADLPDRWSGSQSPSFDISLEPGLAYHLIVAGRVEGAWDGSTGSSAALEVRSATIEVVPRVD